MNLKTNVVKSLFRFEITAEKKDGSITLFNDSVMAESETAAWLFLEQATKNRGMEPLDHRLI